jgi:hypothetical protein
MHRATINDNYVERWLSAFEALLRRYSTVPEAFLRPRIATYILAQAG